MTYIEEYYQFLLKNPDKACHKVLATYKKLVQDIYNPKQVSFFNEITEEQEIHTYIFNETRGNRPINFIEKLYLISNKLVTNLSNTAVLRGSFFIF